MTDRHTHTHTHTNTHTHTHTDRQTKAAFLAPHPYSGENFVVFPLE